MSRHRILGSLVVLVGLHLACGGQAPLPPTPLAPPAPPAPPATQAPTVSAISPSTGSTGGGTPITVTGQGFRTGIIVSVDGEQREVTILGGTSLRLTTPSRAAGAVDLVVTNPGGLSHRVTAGFTYVPSASFDFNGTWLGAALAHPELAAAPVPTHSDMDLLLTIRDNLVVSFVCGGTAQPLVPPVPVANGEFSLAGAGRAITGRIVSATAALGAIDTDDCPGTRWFASKQ